MKASAAEQGTLQEELRGLFRKAKLPTSPVLATQILSLASNPKATTDQFANCIAMDGALAARLLKMANSVMFAQREPVTTIARAVTVLGIGRVKTAALGFQLVDHLNRLGCCPFDMKAYWQHSVLRACIARELANSFVPSLKEEAFLVGLLQDCGILLLVQLLGASYAELYRRSLQSPEKFYSGEKREFRFNHIQAIRVMAAEWNLPESIAAPLGKHHRPLLIGAQSSKIDRLTAVSYFVGSLCLSSDGSVMATNANLGKYARQQFGMNHVQLRDSLRAAGAAYTQMADLLGDNLPADVDITDLLSEANRQLTQVAGEASAPTARAEGERDRPRGPQGQLAEALGAYHDRAARDPLTGILNRGALLESAQHCLSSADDEGVPVTVMFLDIDNFKMVNDQFGQQAGDAVLCGVANVLKGLVCNAGCVGRYGGEEFILILPDLSEEEARDKAEQIVEVVRYTSFPNLDLGRPITCSLGAAWVPHGVRRAAEPLFATTDELMYQAKRSGKDRCCFKVLGSPSTQTTEPAGGGTGGELSPAENQAGRAAARAVSKALNEPGVREYGAALVPELFRIIAERLNRQNPKRFVNMRKQERKEMLAPCVLAYFTETTLRINAENAYVRNISTGGIGLLVTRPLVRGEPVEVTITPHGKPFLYVAGTVAFCRHIEGVIYELGIQFAAHSKQPIFSRDPAGAVESLGWLAQALQEKRSRGNDLEYST